MKGKGRTRAKAKYLIQITTEETELLCAHADPPGTFDEYLSRAHESGPVVTLELNAEDAGELLRLVEETGRHAQNIKAGERLLQVAERLDAGMAGTVDPGAHLLRPAATCVGFTAKQGQYLAFIHCYRQLHGRSPAEAELQAYFRVSPPAVHEMLKTLQRRRYITRRAGEPRSIELLLRPEQIPALDPADGRGAV